MQPLPARPSKLTRLGCGLLVLAAVIVFASNFFPWGEETSHYEYFRTSYDLVLYQLKQGDWQQGATQAFVFACASPFLVAAGLLVGGLLPRGRINVLFSSLIQFTNLLALAVILWALFLSHLGDEEISGRRVMGYGVGAGVLSLLTFFEGWLFRRAIRPSDRWGDSIHALPLVLFAVLGGVVGYLMRSSENWQSQGYWLIAAGSVLGLAGIVLRHLGLRSASPPRAVLPETAVEPD